MDTVDALHDRLAKIATLSDLLYAVTDPTFLDARLASDAGFLIGKELREAKALLDKALEVER